MRGRERNMVGLHEIPGHRLGIQELPLIVGASLKHRPNPDRNACSIQQTPRGPVP